MKLLYILLFCLFSAACAYSAEKSSTITCLTSKCHSDVNAAKYLHSPIKAKGCIVCHEFVDPSEKSKKLPADHPSVALNMGSDQSALCLKCHLEWGTTFKAKEYAHSAIKQKGCTACHNPHGSDNPKFLKYKDFSQELCLSCHKKNENWEKGDKPTAHRAMNTKNKCLNCHDIHSGNRTYLLKDTLPGLCSKCHDDIMTLKENGSLHTPVKNGDCLKCHSPHYAARENLLDKNYEAGTYVKSVAKSFELCLNCHGPFRSTKFRNGDNNLHELHVLKRKKDDKELGCSTCHKVHGASQAMQINTSFSYKKTSLPIAFQKETNGGNCTTACHGKKEYDRITPVINKEGR